MKTISNKKKWLAFVVIALIGFVPRLLVLTRNIEHFVKYIPDDAFYYFQTSRNIVEGFGSTFDGIHLTNGYHPLWMLLMLPVSLFVKDPVIFIRLILSLTITLNFLTAWLLYKLIQKITPNYWIVLIGFTLYYLNRASIFASINSLETSLATCLFIGSVILIFWRPLERQYGIKTHLSITGLILALLFLARTDTIVFIIPLALIEIVIQVRTLGVKAIRPILLFALTMFIIVAPWLIWNFSEFNSLVQVSGEAVPYVKHENYQGNKIDGNDSSILKMSLIRLLVFLAFQLGEMQGFGGVFYQMIIVLSLWVIFRNRKKLVLFQYSAKNWLIILAGLWIGGFVLIIIHVAVRWLPREWYFDQLSIVSILTFVTMIEIFRQELRLTKVEQFKHISTRFPLATRLITALVIILATGFIFYWVVDDSFDAPYAYQMEMLDASLWIKDNTQDEVVVAAFNAGIIGYFSERKTVNLDGVMNNEAYHAIIAHSLFKFVENAGVDYYLDYDPVMRSQYQIYWGDVNIEEEISLVYVVDIPEVDFLDNVIKIYRINN